MDCFLGIARPGSGSGLPLVGALSANVRYDQLGSQLEGHLSVDCGLTVAVPHLVNLLGFPG